MNILHTVESYYPNRNGMSEMVGQISEKLVKYGHSVTVATQYDEKRTDSVINGVKIRSFKIVGNQVNGIEGEIEDYKDFLLNSKFDIVTNFAAQQWATDIALPIIDNINGKKVFVPLGFSALFCPRYREYFSSLINMMMKYDVNIFLSNDYQDINYARYNGVENYVIISNGADEDEFSKISENFFRKKFSISESDFLILHVGRFTSIKGHKEAIQIFNRAKIYKTTLLLVSDDFKEINSRIPSIKSIYKLLHDLAYKPFSSIAIHFFQLILPFTISNYLLNKKIFVIALSRQDLISAYKSADLFLFPSNIECSPIVIFESLASKTPFLATDVGNVKEIVNLTNGGLLLPTIIDEQRRSYADINKSRIILEDIYKNIDLRNRLSQNGYESWKKYFTWEKITHRYEKLYTDLYK